MFSPDVEGVIRRQSGAVARAQLLRRGVTPDAIKHALAVGRLTLTYRGVYAVGLLPDRGRIIAALLAAGPKAVASHWTAAFLYALVPTLPAVVDVTVLGRGRRSRPGLTIHETTKPFGIWRRQGIPVTAPLRTLEDLPRRDAQRLTGDALVRRLITPEQLPQGVAPTRSPLEDALLPLISRGSRARGPARARTGRARARRPSGPR